ncbi:MAG TPA: hypothetical protein VIM18_09175 [Solirubrobacteraceae bacterium]
MELILGTSHFTAPGGSETYLLTVAEQLQRLGHAVMIFAFEVGEMAELARSRGLRVAGGFATLPERCDALLVQDGPVAYELAGRYPGTPQVFRATSDLYDVSLPPNLPGVTSVVVALSERVAMRMRAVASRPKVIRLRQPIDTERFQSPSPPAQTPRRALLLGNYLGGARRAMIVAALAANGIEAHQVGRGSRTAIAPDRQIWDADIVIGKGRAALEGMAGGRAVYVYDEFGSDGWVTAESYPSMEEDNFAGLATPLTPDAPALQADLSRYRAEMGIVNRDLAVREHGARAHACALSEIFSRLADAAPAPDAPLAEMARLVRAQWRTEARAGELERIQAATSAQLATLQEAHAKLQAEHAKRNTDYAILEAEKAELTRRCESLAELTATRRHRAGLRAGSWLDAVRRITGAA